MHIETPWLLFLGDARSALDAKTAHGLVDFRRADCVAQWRLPRGTVDLGLPDMTPAQAHAVGARTLIIGIAPDGGRIAEAWVPALLAALEAGLDIASGMHQRLDSIPGIAQTASRLGRRLIDARHGDRPFAVASGRRRSGLRLLTVGTDCAVGKKYTALRITEALRAAGMDATFRATGQTGIFLSREGIAIDAVVADFVAGAAESLSPSAAAQHWDVIEGQGSLFHPAYAGVSLGLLHGSQPDALVLCHAAGRERLDGYPDFPVPALRDCIDLNLRCARLTNPRATCVAVSVNTAGLPPARRAACLQEWSRELELPCFDPMLDSAASLVPRLRSMVTSAAAPARR